VWFTKNSFSSVEAIIASIIPTGVASVNQGHNAAELLHRANMVKRPQMAQMQQIERICICR
jgi:hypothetical protein